MTNEPQRMSAGRLTAHGPFEVTVRESPQKHSHYLFGENCYMLLRTTL